MSDTANDLPARVAVLEEIARGTQAALERIEQRLDSGLERIERRLDSGLERIEQRLDSGLDGLGRRCDGIERRLDSVVAEHRADFRWTIGIMIAWGATLLGVMAHGFRWI